MTEIVILFMTGLLFLFVILIVFFTARINTGQQPYLRRIEAFEGLKGFAGRAVEAGRPLHLSLGVGGAINGTTADSLAGLYILNYLAEQSTLTGVHPTVSMADPAVMLLAQNVLRAAHMNSPQGVEAAYRNIRWIAPQPVAYAAGVMSLLNLDDVEANIMVGRFGDEYLLIGETAARRKMDHVGGTSDPNTLPFVYASAQEILLGEEIYAAGAYLQKRVSHLGSLLAQDTMRWIIFLLILAGVVTASIR